MAKITIALFDAPITERLVTGLTARGHLCSTAAELSGLAAPLAESVDLLLFNFRGEKFLPALAALKNTLPALKILAAVAGGNLGEMEKLFTHGVDDCLARPFRLPVLFDKVDKILTAAPTAAPVKVAGEITVPEALHARIETLRAEARLLGDVAEIYTGVIAHERGRRAVAPSPEWQMTLTEKSVEPFFITEEREFYLFYRNTVNRIPAPAEYDLPEKVLVRRTMSPLTAALDSTRLPYNSELYGIVPVTGLEAGYLAGVLNSRYARFFFDRYRAQGDGVRGVYFTRFDLEALPLAIAKPREQTALSVMARKIAAISPHERQTAKCVERGKLFSEMNRKIFHLFGFTDSEVKLLGELHY